MKALFILFVLFAPLAQGQWRPALPGWEYQFPRDHGPHPEFKTEWWYFTGNLRGEDGRPYGFELTFFRQGMRPPTERQPAESAWIANEIALAHFAITDMQGKRFVSDHRIGRVGLGGAGFGGDGRLAWVDEWEVRLHADGTWKLSAATEAMALSLTLRAQKPPAINGENGVSQKSSGEGRASHYYSLTRLASSGRLRVSGVETAVEGMTWFDHEWATNQLTREQAGWDWFGLHLDDGSDLMLYQLRLKAGGTDPASSGTLVRPDGQVVHLKGGDFRLTPGGEWQSPETGVTYPLKWKIELPGEGLILEAQPALKAQEMRVPPAAYWEGAMELRGKRQGLSVSGRGYMELTGYGGEVIGITE